MRVAIVGGTGLIGSHVLAKLSVDPTIEKVVAFARRQPEEESLPRVEWRVGDLQHLRSLLQKDETFDHGICCLGTTIKQVGGSKEAFEHVDLYLPVRFAQAMAAAKVKGFHVVSSVGASQRSLSYYCRVKGRMEEAVSALNFPRCIIYRPTLLLGERREYRLGEAIAQPLLQGVAKLVGPLSRGWAPIAAATVAKDICAQLHEEGSGLVIRTAAEMQANTR